jgi:hypothetical protein
MPPEAVACDRDPGIEFLPTKRSRKSGLQCPGQRISLDIHCWRIREEASQHGLWKKNRHRQLGTSKRDKRTKSC